MTAFNKNNEINENTLEDKSIKESINSSHSNESKQSLTNSSIHSDDSKPVVLPKDEFTPSPNSPPRPTLPRKSSKRSPPQLPRKARSPKTEPINEEKLQSSEEDKIEQPIIISSINPEIYPSLVSSTQDLSKLTELGNNTSNNSLASSVPTFLGTPEPTARKSFDSVSNTSKFSPEFISQLSQLECGVDPILDRNKLSINTIRLMSRFLKKKAQLEEEYSRAISKTIQLTVKEMEREEIYDGSFILGFQKFLDYHENISKNRIKFATETNHIADELLNISRDKERTRKSLKDQQVKDNKKLVDSEIGLEKSLNRYMNTSDAWDQSVVLKHNGGRISPDGSLPSLLNHVPKPVATTLGLFNKPKTMEQLVKQEEECKVRAMISKDQYSTQLFHINSARKEYYTKLLPALIRDSLDNINQCDYWAQFYLSTYSYNYQVLIQQESKIICPSGEDTGLDSAIEIIQPIEDTYNFLNTLSTKYKNVNLDPIPLQEYQLSGSAMDALSSRVIFGVELRAQLARDSVKIPIIITKCAEFIEKHGLDFEGLYRVSGASTKIQKLKQMFNHDASKVNLEKIDFAFDISNVAGVLKLYLRELPDPLIPATILEQFIPLMPIEGENPPQILKFQSLLVKLPTYAYETIRYLILHLSKVAAHSDKNKMTPSNIAIVFGPTLFSPPNQDQSDAVHNMTSQCQATLVMLNYSNQLFVQSPPLPQRSIPIPDHLGRLSNQSFDEQKTSGLRIDQGLDLAIEKDEGHPVVSSPKSSMPVAMGGPLLPNVLEDIDKISLDLPSDSNNSVSEENTNTNEETN